jgi:hypothetical protein
MEMVGVTAFMIGSPKREIRLLEDISNQDGTTERSFVPR